jgi:hypothetical protein
MIFNIRDIKRDIKKEFTYTVDKLTITNEEFGEGYNTYVSLTFITDYGSKWTKHYTTGEEETFGKARRRTRNFIASFNKDGYTVIDVSRF